MPSKRANREKGLEGAGRQGEGPGTLYIVATPIGNLSDITLRALDTLKAIDRIAAEDTRHTRKLLSHYDIHKPLVSYHSHNMAQRGEELIKALGEGESIALLTDAGTPAISDPGALLVERALAKEIPVTVIPGPTALITALVASGLPTHPFTFLGFAPNRGSGRRRFFEAYSRLPMTLILYESPKRLEHTLKDILTHWGNRRLAAARELTKLHEEIFRGTVSEALEHFAEGTRGELTLVVAGAAEGAMPMEMNEVSWQEELEELLGQPGMTVKRATEEIVKKHRLPRRTVYQEALGRREESRQE